MIDTERLRRIGHAVGLSSQKGGQIIKDAADEIDRLQRIIDSRPAINAGLPETYIDWSQSIYLMEATQARETPQ